MQRCNDGAIINRWYRHTYYANHPLDLGTQRLRLPSARPLLQESDVRSLIFDFVCAAGKDVSRPYGSTIEVCSASPLT